MPKIELIFILNWYWNYNNFETNDTLSSWGVCVCDDIELIFKHTPSEGVI